MNCRAVAAAACLTSLTLAAPAVAKVPDGKFRGSLYKVKNGPKMKRSPATVVVKGSRVTISAAKFATFCPRYDSDFNLVGGDIEVVAVQFKGKVTGKKVKGTYRPDKNFEIKMDGRFIGSKFVGDLTTQSSGAVGACSGTYTVRAKR